MCCASEWPAKTRRPVIVDTDLSIDDYVALLYLLQHPGIDVRAITVVNGMVHVQSGIQNARRLLSLVGQPDIPVAGGPDQPLAGRHAFPSSWRFTFDLGPRLVLPRASSAAPFGLSAPELIRQRILAGDVPLTFVALGPLTNLALALRADPTLATRVDTIFICGGAINVPGTIHQDVPSNPNNVAEWNLYVDPVAADMVFNCGAHLTLIPLDVTNVAGPQPLLFGRDFVRRLIGAACGRPSKLMVRLDYVL
jgi:inosine-uridine nucleoside N-ribohydrolase